MNDNSGFIVIHRKILDWEWYGDTNTVRLFIHCLLKANWENKQWQGIEIKRGSFVTGRKILAKETGLSEQQVRTSLNKLISTNEITKRTTNKYTVLTINNYCKYQDYNQQITNNQPTNNQQITTTKQLNNKTNNNIINIYEFIEREFGRTLSSVEYEEINNWKDTELTRYAIKQAVLNNKCGVKYISRILSAYERENVKTVQQAQERERQYIEAKGKKKYNTNYVAPVPEWLNQETKRKEVVYTDELQREYEEFERAIKRK
ncbi:MAG: DnaD domain protein [Erysipelotrichaceae bacterium]|nr:DnaD domain protein [Erysipelotrichaceae bacterium]